MSILMDVLNLLAEISWFKCGLTVSAYDYPTIPSQREKVQRSALALNDININTHPPTHPHTHTHTHTHTHLCDGANSF